MRNTVKKLAKCFPTAIVSGRCREKVPHIFNFHFNYLIKIYTFTELFLNLIMIQVSSFVKLTELYYAGSHGMDIKGPEQGSKYKKV